MSDTTIQDESKKKEDSLPRASTAPQAGDVAFNENITIFAGNRLPQYDKGSVKAFSARGVDKAPANLIAYICEDHLTPRMLKAPNYAAILNPSLVRLVASGVVYWPLAGKEKYCFIYENTLGTPFFKDDLRGGMGLKQDLVLNNVIRPMVSVLADMRDKDIVHGNIRLSNFFDGNARNFEKIVLGECLCLPASYNQPVLYEPVDRALCSPIGRGQGTGQDDLYSFGVCLALLLRHFDPLDGADDEEIIERKMEEGTYAVLLGKDRLSGAILELLRGLLYDDEGQRWTIDEVIQWLDGRRLSPKQFSRRAKAARPLLFNGKKYMRPELLAKDLSKNVPEATQLIDNTELEQWLTRALDDKPTKMRFDKAIEMSGEQAKGTSHSEELVARVSMALHPEGPMRYKNITVMPDSIGPAFTEAYMMKRDLQTYHDFFMHYFITQWIDLHPRGAADVGGLISRYDGARAYLRLKMIGGGFEKCLYALNPEMQCISEKLQKFYIRSPEDMMRALEKISALPGRPALFFDRHTAAFLSVKDRKNIDPYLHDLNSSDMHRKVLAEGRIVASIQKRSQMDFFPGIAKWYAENLSSVFERIHDRELRALLKKKMQKFVETGDLVKIVVIFDNPTLYQEDYMNFRKAMRQFFDLEHESKQIEKDLTDENTVGVDTGKQIAAIVSAALSGIIILLTVFTAV